MTYNDSRKLVPGQTVLFEDGLPYLFATVSGGEAGGTLEASVDGEVWGTIATVGSEEVLVVSGVYPARWYRTTNSASANIIKMGSRR